MASTTSPSAGVSSASAVTTGGRAPASVGTSGGLERTSIALGASRCPLMGTWAEGAGEVQDDEQQDENARRARELLSPRSCGGRQLAVQVRRQPARHRHVGRVAARPVLIHEEQQAIISGWRRGAATLTA